MKLYCAKGTCAIGIHVVLEEIGQPYELEKLDFSGDREGAIAKLKAVNPKGKVPTLVRDDGSLVTEYVNIAGWLAGTFKDAGLLPFDDLDLQSHMYEAMEFAVGTLHGKAFSQLFKASRYTVGAQDQAAAEGEVKARGVQEAQEGFEILGEALGQGPWIAGDRYTIGDSALFYTASWAERAGVKLPASVQAHLERMQARPAVQRVRAAWA